MGFMPVDFNSVIEIVDPTRNKVSISNRLDISTIKLVVVSGKM